MSKTILKAIAFLSMVMVVACNKPEPEPEPVPDPTLEISSVKIKADAGTYSIPFTLTNPVAGTELLATTSADWVSNIKVKDSEIQFNVPANFSSERRAVVKIKYGEISKNIAIDQASFVFKSFTIGVQDITPKGGTAVIKPTGHKDGYFFEVFSKAQVNKYLALDSHQPGDFEYGEALYQSDLEYIKSQASSHGKSISECLKSTPSMYSEDAKDVEMKYSGLSLNSEYYLVVYGMDLEGKRTTEIALYLFSTTSNSKSDLTFTAQVSNVQQNSARITINPSNNTDTYYWTYVDEMMYGKMTPEEIMDNMVQNILESVSYGYKMEQFLSRGQDSYEETKLSMGTTYYIFAWGMDMAGNPTTEPYELISFKTLENEVVDECTFDVKVLEVESMDIKVHVEPSNESTYYYTAFIDEKRCVGYNDFQMVQRIINMENSRIEDGFYGDDVTDWTNLIGVYQGAKDIWGRRDLKWAFDPEHSYRIYVFGVDASGNVTTKIQRVDAKTIAAEPSSMTFNVSLAQNNWHYAYFDITPSNNDDYYLAYVVPTDILNTYRYADGSLMEREIMDEIRDDYEDEISQYVFAGPRQFGSVWTSDTDYSLLLFGYAGSNTTPMYEFKYHSSKIPFDKASVDINYTYELFRGDDLIALDPVVWKGCEGDCIMKVNITTSGNPANYYFGIWPPKENFASTGGLDHLVTLVQNEIMDGDNIINKNFGILKPWWDGAGTNNAGFVTEDGENLPFMPWSITAFAEDENGNYGPLHYEMFIPREKPEGTTTGKYEKGYTEAYNFWSSPSVKSIVMKVADPEID